MLDLVGQFLAWAGWVIQTFGYLGIFAVNFIASASIFFPAPAFAFVFAAGAYLNPWLVGLSAGVGAALGELTGYGIGFGGKKFLEKKYGKWIEKTKKYVEKYGMFWIVIAFAALPLPDDIIGLLAGVVKYDIKKFLLASMIGKIIMNLVLAWAGFYGISAALSFFGG